MIRDACGAYRTLVRRPLSRAEYQRVGRTRRASRRTWSRGVDRTRARVRQATETGRPTQPLSNAPSLDSLPLQSGNLAEAFRAPIGGGTRCRPCTVVQDKNEGPTDLGPRGRELHRRPRRNDDVDAAGSADPGAGRRFETGFAG